MDYSFPKFILLVCRLKLWLYHFQVISFFPNFKFRSEWGKDWALLNKIDGETAVMQTL